MSLLWCFEVAGMNVGSGRKCLRIRSEEAKNKKINVADVTAIAKDDLFFTYLKFILLVDEITMALSAWAQFCMCHEDLLHNPRSNMNKRRRAKRRRFNVGSGEDGTCGCIMMGRRLPELVVGKLEELLKTLCNQTLVKLLTQERRGLTPEQWAIVQSDFEIAKGVLESGLRIKFDWLRRLPWSLAGMAHYDVSISRHCGRAILTEFDSLPLDVKPKSHRKILALLGDHEGSLRNDFVKYINGASLHQLPLLEAQILPYRFVLIIERYIEANHALIERHVPASHSPVLVSLARRFPSLEDLLEREPSLFQTLIDCFENTRAVENIPKLTGLERHPQLQIEVGGYKRRDALVQSLNVVLYRADIDSTFTNTRAAQKHHNKQSDRSKREDAKILARHEPKAALTYDGLLLRNFGEHVQQVAAMEPHCIYSLPKAPSTNTLQKTLEARAWGNAQQAPAIDPDFDVDVMPAVPASSDAIVPADEGDPIHRDGSAGCRFFFSIVKTEPGRWHTVNMSISSGKRLPQSAILIAVHRPLYNGDEALPVVSRKPVEDSGGLTSILSSFEGLSMQELTEKFLRHSCSSTFMYAIANAPTSSPELTAAVITSMVVRRAYPGASDEHAFTPNGDAENGCIHELMGLGLVDKSYSSSDDRFVLTSKALASLDYGPILTEAANVAEVRNLPLEDCTTYELMLKLRESGFQWRRMPTESKSRLALEYCRNESPKLWYSGLRVVREYALCLLKAEELQDMGILAIPHWQPSVSHYKALLEGRRLPVGQAHDALEDDVAVAPRAIKDKGARHPRGPRQRAPAQLAIGDTEMHEEPLLEQGDTELEEPEEVDHQYDEFEFYLEEAMAELLQEIEDDAPSSSATPATSSGSAAPARAQRGGPRNYDRSFTWGSFIFTPRDVSVKNPYGAWQASCKFHRLGPHSGCRRQLSMRDEVDEPNVIRTLKSWCVEAENYDRQRYHIEVPLCIDYAPPDELLEALMHTGNLETGPPIPAKTDLELDVGVGRANQGRTKTNTHTHTHTHKHNPNKIPAANDGLLGDQVLPEAEDAVAEPAPVIAVRAIKCC